MSAEIEFETLKYDFGKVKIGDKISHTFIFKNTGDQPLVITKVTPSCGCSVASFTKEPIKAGGTGEIHTQFNTKARPVGYSLKSFIVFSNAKNAPHTIYLKGELHK
jgi:hypothetical protein